jgi:hypothetical protein
VEEVLIQLVQKVQVYVKVLVRVVAILVDLDVLNVQVVLIKLQQVVVV